MGDNVALPKATITKMVKEALPDDLRAAADTSDLISRCCSEFVQLVSSEAAELSTEEKKSTIGPEHIVRALERLGFDDYMGDVQSTWHQLKDDQKGTQRLGGRKSLAEASGMSEQEQVDLQQQLFAAARHQSGFDMPLAHPAPG
ncbi:hypothetical protein WJX73_003722 [Symbiochloris irregularis]|uniref:Transcription factor CBF/NF-Y/archaeal histone domain-containing protein n=1 Tax=Symbiochloris irregularis TaxID=706552 RepID=A0AAW1NML7_9CHLO